MDRLALHRCEIAGDSRNFVSHPSFSLFFFAKLVVHKTKNNSHSSVRCLFFAYFAVSSENTGKTGTEICETQ
jgi:hypothetical protein